MKKILRITAKNAHTRGLMSLFLQVLDNLAWAEQNGYIPTIEFNGNPYWMYDEKYGKNIWNYYFEPITTTVTSDIVEETHFLLCDATKQFLKNREFFHDIYSRYVKILNPITAQKSDKSCLGVHIRGTDFARKHKIGLHEYIHEINSHIDDFETLYVATDSQDAYDIMMEIYWDKILAVARPAFNGDDITRAPNYAGKSAHGEKRWINDKSPKIAGDEILMETQYLAQCDALIHAKSSVSTSALIMNPNLKGISLWKVS